MWGGGGAADALAHMRSIRGDLGLVGIENLLQMLSAAKCEGTLAVVQENQKKVIHIGPQGMRLVSGARRIHPLGEILIRAGKITRSQLDEMLAEQKRSGERLGDIVARRGIASKEEIEFALREQVAEEIFDLFKWKGALFNFTEGGLASAPDSPLAEVALSADVMFVILEAGRRSDEMMKISSVIPDDRMVPMRLELPTALECSEMDRSVVETVIPLIDGESSVAQIIGKSLFPRFTVMRTLYDLVLRGAVKICRQDGLDGGPETVLRRAPPPAGERGAPGGRTVALVGEAGPFRAATAALIKGSGYAVVEGDAGPEMDKLFGGQPPDVVVLDAAIGTDEGLGICARIRENCRSPLVVLTANASRQAVANSLACGARYVLLKPVRPGLLLERISEALAPAEVTS